MEMEVEGRSGAYLASLRGRRLEKIEVATEIPGREKKKVSFVRDWRRLRRVSNEPTEGERERRTGQVVFSFVLLNFLSEMETHRYDR